MELYNNPTSTKETHYPCPLCNSNDFTRIWDKHHRESIDELTSGIISIKDEEGNILHGEIVVCNTCGLIQTNPKMTPDDLFAFYSSQYRELYKSDSHLNNEENHAAKALEVMIPFIDIEGLNNAPEGERINFLDVGASMLRMVTRVKHMLKERVNVVGVEPCKEYSQLGFEFNKKNNIAGDIHVYNGNVEGFTPKEYKFDVVTMLDTLEHTHNPVEVLKHLYEIMDEQALLIVAVPDFLTINSMCNPDAWFSSAHLYHFTANTLSLMLGVCGFKTLKIQFAEDITGWKMYVVAEKSVQIPVTFNAKPNPKVIIDYLNAHDWSTKTREILYERYYEKCR